MENIESKKLTSLRLQKAAALVSLLREEIDDLRRRLNLVEIHNEELQELFNKISIDQAALESAIESSLENVDTEIHEGSFLAGEIDEIESAEGFGISAEDEEDFSFDDEE